jgi:hypothetical protein
VCCPFERPVTSSIQMEVSGTSHQHYNGRNTFSRCPFDWMHGEVSAPVVKEELVEVVVKWEPEKATGADVVEKQELAKIVVKREPEEVTGAYVVVKQEPVEVAVKKEPEEAPMDAAPISTDETDENGYRLGGNDMRQGTMMG